MSTDDKGIAHAMLLSSRQIDAKAKIKAAIDEDEDTSTAVIMQDTDGDMSVDDDTLPADGHSTTTIYRPLTFNGSPVVGHSVRFYIDSVTDADGKAVQPNDPTYSQYGTVTTTQGTSDASGITYGTFTSGTLPGTIVYGSEDTTVVANDTPALAMGEQRPHSSLASYLPLVRVAQAGEPQAGKPKEGSKRIKKAGQNSRSTKEISVNFFKLTTNHPDNLLNGPTSTWVQHPGRAIAKLNSIWSQYGIRFKQQNPGVIDTHYSTTHAAFANSLGGGSIDQRARAKVSKLKRKQANIDIIFVRMFSDFSKEHTMGYAPIPGGWILLSDGSGTLAGSAISHEAGHTLGLYHIVEIKELNQSWEPYKGNLMFPYTGGDYLWTDQNNPKKENQALNAYNYAKTLPVIK